MITRLLSALLLLAAGGGATFDSLFSGASSSKEAEAFNVCVYSQDVSQYPPSCFKCPKEVFVMSLLACVNATELPKNITFTSAKCLEGNCNINYPTAPTPKPAEAAAASTSGISSTPLASFVQQLLSYFSGSRAKRSVVANSVDDSIGSRGSSHQRPADYWEGFRIIGNKSTVASELGFDVDYLT